MKALTFPILTTERLTLRRISINDLQDVYDLRTDLQINKFLGRDLCTSLDDAKKFINVVNDNIDKGSSYYWAITLTNTKQFAGTICLFDFSTENKSCEIGYELMVKFQRNGIMQEALQKVIDFVFQTLKVNTIVASTHIDNKSSINLLLKFNFLRSSISDRENLNLAVFNLLKKV